MKLIDLFGHWVNPIHILNLGAKYYSETKDFFGTTIHFIQGGVLVIENKTPDEVAHEINRLASDKTVVMNDIDHEITEEEGLRIINVAKGAKDDRFKMMKKPSPECS